MSIDRLVLGIVDSASHGDHGGIDMSRVVRRAKLSTAATAETLRHLAELGLVRRHHESGTWWTTPAGHLEASLVLAFRSRLQRLENGTATLRNRLDRMG